MSIAEGREEQPHWVVRREEVELTEEVVGRGGWGEVRVAMFRGLRVAAKFLYDVILSDYNRRQFVLQRVSGNIVQSQCQGVVAEDQNQTYSI